MKRYSFLLASILFIFFAPRSYSQSFNRKTIEKINTKAIEKALKTSVRMWGFDTLKQQRNSSQFSGVVVSAEGHILTAAHATIPGNTYKVFFPDGQERIAVALGRIGFKDKNNLPDVAMMKIVGKGTWPFAELGWSGSLKTNEPCLSISYPETLDQKQPTVRFGRIVVPLNQWGFVQSSCKMEPGDSGGPLFDYLGRVVALHSRIDLSEEVNLEVPVDLYRKYWTALNKVEDYAALPEQQDAFSKDPLAEKLISIPALAQIDKQFEKVEPKIKGTSLMIKSRLNGIEQQAVGTLFLLNNATIKGRNPNGSYLIAKSTLVGTEPNIDSEKISAKKLTIIGRDKANDLVLMQLESPLKSGIVYQSLKDTSDIKFEEIGKFLLSALPDKVSKISILSSKNMDLPRRFSAPYFGANANFINQQIILTSITPGSPASEAKLELKDQVTGINGIPISQPPQYGGEIMKYAPGDTITIQGVRNGTDFNISVALKKMPVRGNHPADRLEGGKSIRLDDFKKVFAHDAAIKADECGGPVFDAEGKFYGINIARFSRTSTLTIPSNVVYKFISDTLQ